MAKEYVKNYPKEMTEINEHLLSIEKVVSTLPAEASFTKSLKTTVINFRKKMDTFLSISAELTPQQKAAIAAIKAGKPESEVSAILSGKSSGNEPVEGGAGSDDEKPPVSPKVKGKRH